jgi:hypothetical protein
MSKYRELKEIVNTFPHNVQSLFAEFEYASEDGDLEKMSSIITKIRVIVVAAENAAKEMLVIADAVNDRGM